jgi:hypothetical protein
MHEMNVDQAEISFIEQLSSGSTIKPILPCDDNYVGKENGINFSSLIRLNWKAFLLTST